MGRGQSEALIDLGGEAGGERGDSVRRALY
jgi:hypothetical protein